MKLPKVTPICESDRYHSLANILNQAQDFLYAYKVLCEHKQSQAYSRSPPLFCSDVVCLTFAIELLFKALLCVEGKRVNSHHLEKLFNALSTQMQEEIKCKFTEHLLKITGIAKDIWGLSFEVRLRQYSDTYNEWRYHHEKNPGSYNSQFCDNLAAVLNEIAHAHGRR